MIEKLLKFYPYAIKRAWFVCRNKELAEDIVQNIFLKLHKSNIKIDCPTDDHIKSYLRRAVMCEYIGLNRLKRNKIKVSEDVFNEGILDSISSPDTDNDLSDELVEALSLPPKEIRKALIMIYLEGYNYQEAADILLLPRSTVNCSMNRWKLVMKDHILGIPRSKRGMRKGHHVYSRKNPKDISNKAIYKGIYFKQNKYYAYIMRDGVRTMLWGYETPEEAVVARDNFIKEYNERRFNSRNSI